MPKSRGKGRKRKRRGKKGGEARSFFARLASSGFPILDVLEREVLWEEKEKKKRKEKKVSKHPTPHFLGGSYCFF